MCNCGKKKPVIINPQPEEVKQETNGEDQTSSTEQ